MNNAKISFPNLAEYNVPATFLFKHILNVEIIESPPITNHTLELGNKYSPETLCTPFKYTLGTIIESINKGANTIFQLGGGCRYGYYHELQHQIIKDLGYDINFINLVSGNINIVQVYKKLKKISKINIPKTLYYIYITIKMIDYMDEIDDFIRKNIGFEIINGSFLKLKKELLNEFKNIKTMKQLKKIYKEYKIKFNAIELRTNTRTKVAIIGELYTLMEPFANFDLEYTLAKHNIEITRFTNATYLLIKKKREVKKMLKKYKKLVKYEMGADATDNICRTQYLIDNNYDGIIHIKSSFCTPEIASMQIINKICGKNNMPVIFLSFDANTSEVGIKTRLEAFVDMLEMRNNNA